MGDEPGDVVFGRDPELETEGVGRTDVWVFDTANLARVHPYLVGTSYGMSPFPAGA